MDRWMNGSKEERKENMCVIPYWFLYTGYVLFFFLFPIIFDYIIHNMYSNYGILMANRFVLVFVHLCAHKLCTLPTKLTATVTKE